MDRVGDMTWELDEDEAELASREGAICGRRICSSAFKVMSGESIEATGVGAPKLEFLTAGCCCCCGGGPRGDADEAVFNRELRK